MAKATILFADNNPQFLKARCEVLDREDYRVITASSPTEAKFFLERGGIDLAILDIRLLNDDDETDISGLTLAKEMARLMPKIILTNYPNIDAVCEAFKPQLDGLPIAVEFITKDESPEKFIIAVEKALGPDTLWLQKVKQVIDWTESEIRDNHKSAQKQSKIYNLAALLFAVIGIAIIIWGIFLVFSDKLEVGIASSIGGIITGAIGYLFFKRADLANWRMDKYHKELVQGQRFQTLLHACNGIYSEQERESCQKQVIIITAGGWLGLSKNDYILPDKAEKK